jgi:N-acyl-D-amino-acid deacylase
VPQDQTATLIRDVLIVDGTGVLPYRGEVLIVGDEIAAVGAAGSVEVAEDVQVETLSGLMLAPGFIDIHNHSDNGILNRPAAEALISQGETTIIVGPDGSSAWPIADYLRRVESARPAVNVGTLVGHGTIRRAVMGDDYRRTATAAEVQAMASRVARGMQEGAFGLSSGLEYDPGFYSDTAELIELSRVAAARGGFYMSHIRDEEEGVMEAIAEAIEIGRTANLPVQISHIKMGNASVWGGAPRALEMIRSARATGVDVYADWYPYQAWASSLNIVVRSRRFTDPEEVAAGLEAMGGADRLQITNYPPDRSFEGRRLLEIAQSLDKTPVDLYIEMMRAGGASVIGHTMDKGDVDTFAASPLVMVASDGGIGSSHPRGAGTFSRVLGYYVREQGVLPIERAIYKMTSLPARRLGLEDRGRIVAGGKADLVAFDPSTVSDASTFEESDLLSVGIERVWVNGQLVWSGGAATGTRPGRALRPVPRR